MNQVTITLPLPARILSPNHTIGSRGGRMAKATATRKHRKHALEEAQIAMGSFCSRSAWYWPSATVRPTFYFPTAARRDKDNCLGWIKAYMDGIADAGLVADDADFTYLPVRIEKDKDRPRVELVITNTAGAKGASDGLDG